MFSPSFELPCAQEAQLMQLVSYIKSMKAPETGLPAAAPAPAAAVKK
jgi:hypothetical protein